MVRGLTMLLLLTLPLATLWGKEGEQGLSATEGLSVASWEEAGRLIGKPAVIYGKVINVGQTKGKGIHFLNFAEKGNGRNFTAVIFKEANEAFANEHGEKTFEELFLEKNITVRGTVSVFKGGPQIVVASPHQIDVVDKLPKTKIVKMPKITTGDELVIGSYNVKNLFDAQDDPYHRDEGTDPKPRDEIERIANVIHELNADVLALQEVESRGYLQHFVDALLPDMGYKHIVHFEGNDGRGIDVCLISRVPVGAVTSHRHHLFKGHDGKAQRFGRDLLRVELLPEGGDPFEMWLVHLKSNSGGKELNEPIRLGECREIHRLIGRRLKNDPQVSLILCGDFNDEFDTKTVQTILGTPQQLVSIFENIPPEQRITYNRAPYRSMIDFMFCSPAMVKRMVPGSFAIREGTSEGSGSDHNPISARFMKKGSENVVAGEESGAKKTVRKAISPSKTPTVAEQQPATNHALLLTTSSLDVDSADASLQDEPKEKPATNHDKRPTLVPSSMRIAGLGLLGLGLLSLSAYVAIAKTKSRG